MRSDDIPKVLDRLEPSPRTRRKEVDEQRPIRCRGRDEYDLCRRRRPASWTHDDSGPAEIHLGVYPGDESHRSGCEKPGIVFTLYNWARPRDLSHYERFEHDHATFYRQVEPLSVTPFSRRALDRGLTAVAVALVRHEGADRPIGASTNPESGAQQAAVTDQELRNMLSCIVDRVAKIQPDPGDRAYVQHLIDQLLDLWADRQRSARKKAAPLSYSGRDGKTAQLLLSPEPYHWDRWTAPNSLRETEHTINLLLSEGDSSAGEDRPYLVRPVGPQAPLPSIEDPDSEEIGDEQL